MTSGARAPAVVVGVGSPLRSDDAVGPEAVRALQQAGNEVLHRPVDLVVLDGEPARVLEAIADRRLAVVVDAIRTGSAPGTVHRVEWTDDVPPPAARRSSHGNGLREALALAAVLGRLPDRTVVVGIEPDSTAVGEGLSPVVAAALPRLVQKIGAELDGTGSA